MNPQETLHREKLCSQVPRQVIWRGRRKNDENQRNWTHKEDAMRLGQGNIEGCT